MKYFLRVLLSWGENDKFDIFTICIFLSIINQQTTLK